MQHERRKHQRLAIRLPIECRFPGTVQAFRCATHDISTGGVFFDLDLPEAEPQPQALSVLDLAVTIPPGPGHSPYEGRVFAAAEVLRCTGLSSSDSGRQSYSIAARFKQPLQLRF
jgi:hypothetical protein